MRIPQTNVVAGKRDVIGYAFAINGKINSADVYASNALFTKLWPKLLKSTAVEAVGEKRSEKTFDAPAVTAVRRFIAEGKAGSARVKHSAQSSSMVERENDQAVYYGTEFKPVPPAVSSHSGAGAAAPPPPVQIHENYLAK
ncbi:MAG TPA: DUF6569 family protein [Candidatus Obscuribacterales bacterium]